MKIGGCHIWISRVGTQRVRPPFWFALPDWDGRWGWTIGLGLFAIYGFWAEMPKWAHPKRHWTEEMFLARYQAMGKSYIETVLNPSRGFTIEFRVGDDTDVTVPELTDVPVQIPPD